MAIKVTYVNPPLDSSKSSDEELAALRLKDRFTSDLQKYSNASGTIYIISSVRIFNSGKRTDIDLLVLGCFDNFIAKGKHDTRIEYSDKSVENIRIDELDIKSFICNIEVKSHNTVEKDGTNYIVKYPNGEEKASEQCYEEKFAVKKMLEKDFGIKVFISDFLWFTSIQRDELNRKKGGMKDNAFPSVFSFDDFLDTMLLQCNVYKSQGKYHIDCFPGRSYMTSIVDIFTAKRNITGLTKKKFELLNQKDFDPSKVGLYAGDKFTKLSGRAGTGKTIQLLQLALNFVSKKNSRCLLLTYNNALVSDIKHLIDYFALPAKLNKSTLQINTVDSFFLSLMKHLEVVDKRLNPSDTDYSGKYSQGLENLKKYIIDKVTDAEVPTLKELIGNGIDWDFLFIDECQDWDERERDILFKMYGPERIIVADGIDQFNRCSRHLTWEENLNGNYHNPGEMRLEMRQKANLARFVNLFAKENNIDWEVQPNYELPGGKIIVTKGFKKSLYDQLVAECGNNNCDKYDILFLAPPQDVVKEDDGSIHYKNYDMYNSIGVTLFDGTNPANRKLYPTDDMPRLYQYDSCRGLEGWVTICLNFDQLIEYKMKSFIYDPNGFPSSPNKQRDFCVYLWSLMPLTRPTDTLVISLKDADSLVGQTLKCLATRYPTFIEWR